MFDLEHDQQIGVHPSVVFFLSILQGGDDEQNGIAKMLPLWELVQARSTQRVPPALLCEAGVPGCQQAGEPAEVVPKEPALLSRGIPCEAGSGLAPGASGVLEAAGCAGGAGVAGCVTRCLPVATP